MTLPYAYKKILERMKATTERWDEELAETRRKLREEITRIRFTKEDAKIIIRELLRRDRLKRINKRKVVIK